MTPTAQNLKLILFLCLSISFFQSCKKSKTTKINYATGNPADWPKEQDAVLSAAKNHKILLENDYVRVLEVTVLPREVEALHHHQWPSVLYLTQTGDFIDRDSKGTIIEDSRTFEEPIPLPFVMYKDPEAPHSVENLSDAVAMKLIRVELKPNHKPYNTTDTNNWNKELDAVKAAPKNHNVLLENDKVRVLDVTVMPREIEALHHHKWSSILHLMQADEYIDRDEDGNILLDSRKRLAPLVLPFTLYKDPQATHSVENLSDSIPMKILRVELK